MKKQIVITFIFFSGLNIILSDSIENKYTKIEYNLEDPLINESWAMVKSFYLESSFSMSEKDVCTPISVNYKYENHSVFTEYIFATKNAQSLNISLYECIVIYNYPNDSTYDYKFKDSWKLLELNLLINNDIELEEEKFRIIKEKITNRLAISSQYNVYKISGIRSYEKVNKVQDTNLYVCSVYLNIENFGKPIGVGVTEEFLLREDVESNAIFLIYVPYSKE